MATAFITIENHFGEITLRFESKTEKRNGEKWATDIELVEVELNGEIFDSEAYARTYSAELWDHLEARHTDISDWEE